MPFLTLFDGLGLSNFVCVTISVFSRVDYKRVDGVENRVRSAVCSQFSKIEKKMHGFVSVGGFLQRSIVTI
jgi:hypothetical protein